MCNVVDVYSKTKNIYSIMRSTVYLLVGIYTLPNEASLGEASPIIYIHFVLKANQRSDCIKNVQSRLR